MAPKRKGKKRAATIDPETQEKIDKLEDLLKFVRESVNGFENNLQTMLFQNSNKINSIYNEVIASLDSKIKDMTIAQIQEMDEMEERKNQEKNPEDRWGVEFERTKMISAKKMTAKNEKKRSISANSSSKQFPFAQPSSKRVPRISHAQSEPGLYTPASKKIDGSSNVITPKFNTKAKVFFARKPEPGEVAVSLSGSPLKFGTEKIDEKNVDVYRLNGKIVTVTIKEAEEAEKAMHVEAEQSLNVLIENIKQKFVSASSSEVDSAE